MPGRLPVDVDAAIRKLLRKIDDAAPGLIEALWIEGSVALGDYRRTSDIDFVALCGRAPPPRLISRTRPSSWSKLQGTWLTRPQLAALGHGLGAITLATLYRHGIAVRGPEPSELVQDVPHGKLAAVCVDNAASYWARWHARASRCFPDRIASLHPRLIVWGASGIARQLVTIAEGRIVSKTEGLRWARLHFDTPWHRVLVEAIRLRTGEGPRQYRSPLVRRRDMLGFVEEAIGRAIRQETRRAGGASGLSTGPAGGSPWPVTEEPR